MADTSERTTRIPGTSPDARAYSPYGRRRRGLGWLPWAALLLLALTVLGVFLIMRNVADEGDRAGIDLTNDRRGGATEDGSRTTRTTGRTGDESGSSATSVPAGSASPAQPATGDLTASGRSVLTAARSGGLSGLTGSPVEGRGVLVQSVVADEGFWVGPSPGNRVFVFLTPQARSRAGESPFQVQAGQRVDLSGALRPVPADVTPFGVTATEGEAELRAQRQYVEATSVRLS